MMELAYHAKFDFDLFTQKAVLLKLGTTYMYAESFILVPQEIMGIQVE